MHCPSLQYAQKWVCAVRPPITFLSRLERGKVRSGQCFPHHNVMWAVWGRRAHAKRKIPFVHVCEQGGGLVVLNVMTKAALGIVKCWHQCTSKKYRTTIQLSLAMLLVSKQGMFKGMQRGRKVFRLLSHRCEKWAAKSTTWLPTGLFNGNPHKHPA